MFKKARFSDQAGQAMVELALITPLIILLILAIIDFGRIYSAQLVLSHAVRSGARAATVLDTSSLTPEDVIKEIRKVVNDDAQFITINSDDIDITNLPWPAGGNVTVDATYEVVLTAPIVEQVFGGSYEIESSVTMRRE
ncbi:hypothetical protein SDC9_173745 [bioreactor metagenome]|uniref:TadE-like domain-containing protein n=1 Tax=bioreactor metagenome TaxID=1076179 RepID=A0A645GH84_9ZZZZ|nr:TadE/TadG family type IV pilus assembly protein [Syntrophomonadaceae bacterium]